MKRMISIVAVVLLFASLCCLSVSAGDEVIVIADNFNSLTYAGNTYVRVENADAIDFDYSTQEKEFALSKRQSAEIRSIAATVDGYRDAYVVLDVWYKTGNNERSIAYVNQERLDEYTTILSGQGHAYTMQINYSMDDDIVMTEDQLKGEAVVKDGSDVPHTNSFAVWVENEDGCFSELGGSLLVDEFAGEYYYLDYFQNGVDDYYNLMTDLGSCEDVTLYRITDAALLTRIESDYAAYYDAQLMPYTETVGKTLSAVMIALIFGVVPFVLLIVGVIGWVNKRGIYCRLFAALSIVCAAEIAAFVTVCVVCLTG